MATDIQNILKQAQSVINTGVKTVKETRITADILQKNIEITDRKIGIHNVNEEAHPDIRAELESLFSLPNGTIVDGPSVAEQNFKTTWTLSISGADKNTFAISYYRVYLSTGEVFKIDPNADGTGTYESIIPGNEGDVVTISATAVMTNNYRTLVGTKDITLTKHTAPDISALVTTFPEVVSYGKTYTWTVSGITDVDEDLSDITVTLDNDKATLSQSTNIKQGTEYTLTIADDLEGPGTLTATVTAIDSYGYTNSASVNMRINQRPFGIRANDLDNYYCLRHLPANATNTWCSAGFITESTTSDSGTITYKFDPDGDSIVSADIIVDNDAITISNQKLDFDYGGTLRFDITVGDLDPGTPYTFTFIVTDEYGAQTITKYTSTINYPPDISNAIVTGIPEIIPVDGSYPNHYFHVNISGIVDPDGDGINLNFGGVKIILGTKQLGYSDGIQYFDNGDGSGQLHGISIRDNPVAGSDIPFKILISDYPGDYVTLVDTTIHVNSLPDVSSIDTADLVVTPGSSITLPMEGATDADGQELTYEWTCDNENVQILVSNGATALLKMPDESTLARGSQCTLTLTVSDGLDSVTKTCKVTVNSLPVISDGLCTIPDTMVPGVSHTFTVDTSKVADIDNNLNGVYINFDPQQIDISATVTTEASNPSSGMSGSMYSLVQGNTYTITLNPDLASDIEKVSYTLFAIDTCGERTEVVKEITVHKNTTAIEQIVIWNDDTMAFDKDGTELIKHLGLYADEIIFKWNEDSDSSCTITCSDNLAHECISGSDVPVNGRMLRFSREPESNPGDKYTITFTFTDSQGAVTSQTFEGIFNTPPVAKDISCTLPDYVAPGGSYKITLNTGGSDTETTVENLDYTLNCYNSDISLTKWNFVVGESIEFTVSDSAKRGSTISFFVTVKDESGDTAYKEFTTKVNQLPNADDVTCPVEVIEPYGIWTILNPNQATDPDDDPQQRLTYTWTCSDSRISARDNSAGMIDFVIEKSNAIPRGTKFTATCTVSDGVENVSKTFNCRVNELPDFSNAVITAPTLVTAGGSYPFKISGVTDPDGTIDHLMISDTDEYPFCLTVRVIDADYNDYDRSIAQDTDYTLLIGDDIPSSGVLSYTISAFDNDYVDDGSHECSRKVIEMRINEAPDLSNAVFNIPSKLTVNSSSTCSVTGVTDPEGTAVTYSITSSDPNITFSKSSGIAIGEEFTINTGAMTEGSVYTLTLTFTDEDGGTYTKTIESTINKKPDASALSSTLPSIIAPGKTYTISFSGVTDPDGGDILYNIYSYPSSFNFSKTKNIAAGEEITVTISDSITRGTSSTINVGCKDSDGAEVYKDISFTVNSLPDLSSISIRTEFNPESTIGCGYQEVKDNDGQSLAYAWTCSNDKISVEYTSDEPTIVRVITPTEDVLPRGTEFTITCTVSDGVESTSKTFDCKIHELPDISKLTYTFPSVVSYGNTYDWSLGGTVASDVIIHIELDDNYNASLSSIYGISIGNTYTLTTGEKLIGPGTLTATIVLEDNLMTRNSIKVPIRINAKPKGRNFYSSLTLNHLADNAVSSTQTICWDDDPDGDAVTCKVTCDNSNITITEVATAANSYQFTATTKNMGEGTAYTFTFTYTDAYGAQTVETISSTIAYSPDATNTTCSLPAYVIPGSSYTITFAGYNDPDDDINDVKLYACDENGVDITTTEFEFSRIGSALKNQYMVIFTPNKDLTRGTTHYFRLVLTDRAGLTSSKVFSYKVNQRPDTTNVVCSINDKNICTPSTSYTITPGIASDADTDQTLTHSWSCTNSKADVVWNGTTLTFKSPSVEDMPRGTTCDLVYACNDGYETARKTFTIKMNSVPEGTLTVQGIPTEMYGGYCNYVDITVEPTLTEADGAAIWINMAKSTPDSDYDGYVLDDELLTDQLHRIDDAANPMDDGGWFVTMTDQGCLLHFSVSPVETETTMEFTIYAMDDDYNEIGVSQQFSVLVKPVIRTTKPSVTSPAADATVAHENGFTATFSEYSSYTTTDETDIAVWTNYRIAENGVDTTSAAYLAGYEEGDSTPLDDL